MADWDLLHKKWLGFIRPLKFVMSAASSRQKLAKKRSLQFANKHFEPIFNTEIASAIEFQKPVTTKQAKICY
ncbi:MAG: hypothetical protein DYH15_01120 [Nitrosomonas sp. PRO4]|nr:hypothetical protein [Nitrosomonas sp. PRO4]